MNAVFLYLTLPLAGALTSLILVSTKPRPALSARRWLVWSMVCGALASVLLAHYYLPEMRESVGLSLLCDGALLCLPPCLYMCIYRLTSLRPGAVTDYWVFVPGLVLWLLLVALCAGMGATEAQAAIAEIVLRIRPDSGDHGAAYRMYAFFGHAFFRSYMILTIMSVLGWGAYAMQAYSRQLDDYLANNPTTKRDFAILYLSFVLMVGAGLIFAACEYSQTFVPWVLPVFCAAEALSMLLMGCFARRVIYSAEQLVSLRSEYEETEAPEQTENPLQEQLERVKTEHLYRDADLTIFRLSRLLCTNRTYLTRAFRTIYGCSFAEYINRLRIEEARELIDSHSSLTLSEIAKAVGYNSATSLYRNYVKIYHKAPRGKGHVG